MPVNHDIQEWPVEKLKPHPQNIIFNEPGDLQLEALANDIERNGLQHPIEVLPDGTIIAGHRRLRAVQFLGWEQVPCRVRYDLDQAGEAEVYRYLLTDNLNRRQCTIMERARATKELYIVLQETNPEKSFGWVKQQCAALLNVSTKTVSRYRKLLDTPRSLQDAFDRDEISLVLAVKVAKLPHDVKQEIGARIEAGECAKAVALEYLPTPEADNGDSNDETCADEMDESEENTPEFAADQASEWLSVLADMPEVPGHLASPIAAIRDKLETIESRLLLG